MDVEKYIAKQHNGTVVLCTKKTKEWSNMVQSCEVHQNRKQIPWRQHIAHRKDKRAKTNTMQPQVVH
jgi:hypothetical protein